MQIELTKSDFGSEVANVARLKLCNMYVVENPLSVSGFSYIRRPSLTTIKDIGLQPNRGLWSQNKGGVTSLYIVSGTLLYLYNLQTGSLTPAGTLPGTDLCQFASSIFHVAILADGGLYLSDGEIITRVDIPDNLVPTSVTSLDNYFLISCDNSNKIYYLLPGEKVIDPLSFLSAERNPDDVKAVKAINDEVWVLGEDSTEILVDSGDIAAPFVRLSGRVYDIGCYDPKSVVRSTKNSLPCLIWVSSNREVILAKGVPSKISNESIEELLKPCTSFVGWSFRRAKHDFYVLTTETVTVVYDLNLDLWFRWFNYGQNTWSAYTGVQVNDVTYTISGKTTTLEKLEEGFEDYDDQYIICEVSGFVPISSQKSEPCSGVTLLMNFGSSGSYVVNPIVELRWSDDSGFSWSTYVQGQSGLAGEYSSDIRFRSLGLIRKPGRYFEIRFTDVESFRLDGAIMNE
jgi:hypothetical protein